MKNQTEKIKMRFSFQIGYIFFIKHDFGRSLSPYVLTKRVFMKKSVLLTVSRINRLDRCKDLAREPKLISRVLVDYITCS